MPVDIPSELVEEIKAGKCVAFVGAGFSAAAGMPGWSQLLRDMARAGTPGRPAAIEALDELLSNPRARSRDLEMAAQVLQDELGEETYRARLKEGLSRLDSIPEPMARRIAHLTGIPFQAIVTTNFDPLLVGGTPGPLTYRALLRPQAHRWWDQRFWPQPDGTRAPGPMVLKIHGDVSRRGVRDVVFTRREYRSRLHGNPAYLGTLRALFATTTVLYLGYSLSDEYLNQVRSELLEAMGSASSVPIMAYALLPDPTPLEQTYYSRHEGIQLLPYRARTRPPHREFDAFLERLYEQTNPIHILASRLQGRRILWMDPNDDWNEAGMAFLNGAVARASATSGHEPQELFVAVDDVEQACQALDAVPDDHFDLIITRWGHHLGRMLDGTRSSDAQALLERLAVRRAQGREAPPVLVFATGAYADENKPIAMRAGALAYTSTWETLFQQIDRVLAPGSETL